MKSSFKAYGKIHVKKGALLKIFIAKSFIQSPIKFRLFLLSLAIISGMVYPWLEVKPVLESTLSRLLLLMAISAIVYAFMLTLYRILQRLFKRRLDLPEGKVDFDERILVRAVGLFGFIPFGAMLHLNFFSHISSDANFGKIMIAQGLALSLGAWFSQIIKK